MTLLDLLEIPGNNVRPCAACTVRCLGRKGLGYLATIVVSFEFNPILNFAAVKDIFRGSAIVSNTTCSGLVILALSQTWVLYLNCNRFGRGLPSFPKLL
jgi:hypothetical protein